MSGYEKKTRGPKMKMASRNCHSHKAVPVGAGTVPVCSSCFIKITEHGFGRYR
jgi:hypothetical protein